MKRITALVFLLIPAAVLAQNFQGMGEADMQNMMQQMQQMEECMGNIDEARMEELQKRSEQVDAEIKSLCAQGKRDEAQKRAISFGREMAADPTVQQMQKCGELVQGMMPGMEYMQERDYSDRHVCDN